jgi:4-hydroxy-tetrahydrodipicolinate synthase
VFALLLTPFRPTGDIDWETYRRYVDWQLEQRPHGLFASCGSSELKHLTGDERVTLARRAVERAGATPVVAVANADAELSRHEEELARMVDTGVSGVVFIPPNGMGHDQERLGDYFAELAAKSPVPTLLYEIPSSRPKDIAPATYGRLVREANVHGVKDTSGTLAGALAKLEAAPDGVLYQAVAPFLLETLRAGGNGVMAIVSTAAAGHVVALWEAIRDEGRRGDGADGAGRNAERLQSTITYLNAVLELGYVATAKYLVSLSGVPMGLTCRTGSTLSAPAAKSVETWYADYGREV